MSIIIIICLRIVKRMLVFVSNTNYFKTDLFGLSIGANSYYFLVPPIKKIRRHSSSLWETIWKLTEIADLNYDNIKAKKGSNIRKIEK